jgi:hypothetical protein
MKALSLYEEGLREAERHKWIESQKHGIDLGDRALTDWFRQYWPLFCRLKCLEHLSGSRSWCEFDPEDFGLIGKLIRDEDLLLEMILDRAHAGMENLPIIVWAQEWGLPLARVITILEQLNLNRAQLWLNEPPRFARPGTIQAELAADRPCSRT